MSRKNGKTPILNQPDGRREQEFTTSLGVKVFVGPLPPMLPNLVRAVVEAEWRENGQPLPVRPTYKITNVAGDSETHEHDETTLSTDEDRAAWAAWQKATATFGAEVTNRTFEEIVRSCVRFDVPPEWKRRYKRLRPPDDPDDQQWFYARAAVIGSRGDVERIMTIASQLTGVDERLIAAAEDSFRGDVEEKDAAAGVAEQAG